MVYFFSGNTHSFSNFQWRIQGAPGTLVLLVSYFLYFHAVGGLLGPRAVRVSGTAETERLAGKPSV